MCHLAVETRLWLKTCNGLKKKFLENNGKIFQDKLQQGKHGNVIKMILETCGTDQRHETGRLKHTCTEENVIIVDEMVGLLNHKGQKQTYRSIHQISKETDLIKCSIVQIIHCIFGRKCILFIDMLAVYIIVSFSCICISQGSLATQLTCGGIFNNHFIANRPHNAPLKEFWKLVDFWWRYGQK